MFDNDNRRRSLPHTGSVVVGAFCALLAGCSVYESISPAEREAQREAKQRTEQLQELQLNLMRYADEYKSLLLEASNRLQATLTDPKDRLMVQNWKVSQAESVFLVASGPNALTNALDMVVLATLSRMVIEDAWVSEKFGDRVQMLRDMHKDMEEQAWRLTKKVLTDPQRAQLLDVITRWREHHPDVRAVSSIHFSDFVAAVGGAPSDDKKQGGLFSLIGLDPLSNLDPAVREITQTRQLAERSIFYLQRAPGLLNLQMERFLDLVATQPEAQTVLSSVDRISLLGSAADRLSTSLPDIIAKEREALINQLSREIAKQKGAIGAISNDLRLTLESGTETMKELNATLQTLDRFTARFVSDDPASRPKPDPNAKPFDILDYATTIRELATATRELNTLATSLDTALPKVRSATQIVTGDLELVLNRAFTQLMTLVVVAIVGTLLAALGYRVLVNHTRIGRRD